MRMLNAILNDADSTRDRRDAGAAACRRDWPSSPHELVIAAERAVTGL
jgi:hypothetical protein